MAHLVSRCASALALLWLALGLCASGAATPASPGAHDCCAGMSEPCAADDAPCTSLAATPCCKAAPAAAWPSAQQRDSANPTLAQTAAAALCLQVPAASDPAPAPEPAAPASLVRRSVVLRL